MDENWHKWKERMRWGFYNCDINGYVTGDIKHPNEAINAVGTWNWDKNDSWAQQSIMHNVTSSQMNHIGSKLSAEEMFSALSITHDNKAHQTVNHTMQDQITVRATPKSNTVDNVRALQGDATVLEQTIKLWWERDNNRTLVDEGGSTHYRWWES